MTIRRAHHLAWRKIGQQTVILDGKRNLIFGLNPPGSEVWHKLDGSSTANELAETMNGVDRFVFDLGRRGLLAEQAPKEPEEPELSDALLPRVVWQDQLHDVCLQFSAANRPGQGPGCSGTGGKAGKVPDGSDGGFLPEP